MAMSAKSLNVASLVKAIMDKDHTRADALVRSGQIDLNAKHGPNGRTALMYACEVGNSRIARLLLLKGAEVDISDDMNEDTALHIASAKDESCVRCLLEYRANVNLKTKNDQTPLYQAVAEGHEEIVRLLLEHRADINAKNKRMNTPLHWASLYNKITIAQLLMEHNPDLTVRNREGRTPVDIARSKSFDQMACVLESKTDAARQLGSEYLTVINTPSPEAGRETIPNPLQEATEYVKPISLKSSPYSCSTPPSDSENRQDTVDGYGIIVRDNPHPVEHECPSREISAEDIYTPAGVTQRKTPQTVLRRTTDERVDKMEREVHRLQEQLRSSNIVSPKVFRRISSLEEMVADVYNKDMNTGWENTRQKFPQGQVPTGPQTSVDQENLQQASPAQINEIMQRLDMLEKTLQVIHGRSTSPKDQPVPWMRRRSRVERIKDCIQSRHTHLIENLEPNGHIDFLFQEQVFSPEEYEELTCREQSKFTKVRELMKKLFTKPADRWVYKFVESLKRDSAVENLAAEFQNVD